MSLSIEMRTRPGTASRTAWVSLVSAWLAWLFDAMDLQLFTLIMFPSVGELIGSADPARIARICGIILAGKLGAWGIGGIVFGVVADRYGRARTMLITVLIYAVFTGASALAHSWWQLAIGQALAAIGIGGEWAAGTALIAETWPARSRTRALLVMQTGFAFGFMLAAVANFAMGPIGWRFVLATGVAPAALALLIRFCVAEPDRWRAVRRHDGGGPLAGIFAADLRWRTFAGVAVAAALMIGTFSTATLLPIWIPALLGPAHRAQAITITSQCFLLINLGGVAGYLILACVLDTIGRRWSYFVVALGSIAVNLLLFTSVTTTDGLLRFAALYGFFAIGGFGSIAAYLPELFPTRVRATGQGFCWNSARVITAAGPLTIGSAIGAFGSIEATALVVTCVYLIGAGAIWFLPETTGLPLED
jgi:MFS family permease